MYWISYSKDLYDQSLIAHDAKAQGYEFIAMDSEIRVIFPTQEQRQKFNDQIPNPWDGLTNPQTGCIIHKH